METAKEKEAMATFMEFMKADHYTEDIPIYILPRYSPYEDLLKDGLLVAETLPEDMLFDSSWDWLMPLGRKITTEFPEYDETEYVESILVCIQTFVLADLYKAIMEFLNWYYLTHTQ